MSEYFESIENITMRYETLAAAQDDTARYRLDVATRADAAELEVYESMPIEDFGKAYLRGLGWEEGKGVGADLESVCCSRYHP